MFRRIVQSPIFSIAVAVFILFYLPLLRGEVLFWGTPILQFIPWRIWAWETLLSGEIPLWNPLSGMGSPLIANYQSGLLYPPNWLTLIAYSLGGVGCMVSVQTILVGGHVIWAGWGMALLLRREGVRELATTIGGLAFALSGYMIARAGFFSINAAVAWIPWVILVVDIMSDPIKKGSQRPLCTFWLVFLIAMQLLSGHAQTTWLTLMLAYTWLGFRVITQKSINVRDVQGEKRNGIRVLINRVFRRLFQLGKAWAILSLSIVISACLDAAQLLPTIEYLVQSQRAGAVEYELAMTYSFWPWHWINLIAPNFFGNPASGDYWGYGNYWEDAIYIGLLPFLLALKSIMTVYKNEKRKLIYFLIGLIAVAFILALGANTPIYPWLYHNVPGFQMFQAPARFTLWAVFALSYLAGLGSNSLHRPQGRALYWIRLSTIGCLAMSMGALLLYWWRWSIHLTMIRATAITGLLGFIAGLLVLTAPSSTEVDRETTWYGKSWRWLVILFVMSDLIFFGWGLNPTVKKEIYLKDAPNAELLHENTRYGRIYIPSEDEYHLKFQRFFRFDTFKVKEAWENVRAVQLPNVNLLDKIPSANNFDPLIPYRYAYWMEVLNHVNSAIRLKMLRLMNVSVVMNVNNSQPFGVAFQEIEPYGRIRWVPCVIWVEEANEGLNLLLNSSLDYSKVVIMERLKEDKSERASACNPEGAATINVLSETPNNIELQVVADSQGYLVISDVWYPGWIATVNGHSTPIYKANYLFKGIIIPEGESRVVLSYQPSAFYAGLGISAISWGLWLAFLFMRSGGLRFIGVKCVKRNEKWSVR